jgi:hypothetical protein
MYSLILRYYMPGVGRFVSEDAYSGKIYEMDNSNKYMYCINSPLNFIDPKGFSKLIKFYEGDSYNYVADDKLVDSFKAFFGSIPFVGIATPMADSLNSWTKPSGYDEIDLRDKRKVQEVLGNLSTDGTYLGYLEQVFTALETGGKLVGTAAKISGILSWIGTGCGVFQGIMTVTSNTYTIEKAVELSGTIGWDTKEKATLLAIYAENAMSEMLEKGEVSIGTDEYGGDTLIWNCEDSKKIFYDTVWNIKSGYNYNYFYDNYGDYDNY